MDDPGSRIFSTPARRSGRGAIWEKGNVNGAVIVQASAETGMTGLSADRLVGRYWRMGPPANGAL
jgi:hypothetical protein